jgi:hypothetical protein
MPTRPEDIFKTLALRVGDLVTAEVYERVGNVPMLAHYTSIDACKSMLASRELWFSRICDTNDTSEAVEGTKIVAAALAEFGPIVFDDYSTFDVAQQFDARRALLETDTYVLSLCEHGSDEQSDRLPMWQAYGHNGNGLCVVLNRQAMLGQHAKGLFPVHWVPIEYENPTELGARVRVRLERIRDVIASTPAAGTLPPQAYGLLVTVAIVQLVLGHKNPAFRHESELRFVRSRLLQALNPPAGAGYRNIPINGQTRRKFVLPLRNYPEFSIDASLRTILDHVIVGPSVHQIQNAENVRVLLDQAGLGHVEIRLSTIPYRAR